MIRSVRVLLTAFSLLGAIRLSAADMKTNSMSSEILASSAKVSAALAADDLSAAKSAATALADHATMAKNTDVATKASALSKAEKIADARKELIALTAAVEPLAKGQQDYVVMNCPMAGADWVQAKGKTQNPYYGKSMLTCGAPKQNK
ncbi:MAG: hypothetical protein ABIZ04_02830 [Opitutus sp.]